MKFSNKNILYIYKSIKKLRRQQKMAFLMLLHEKMRLQRKVNKLTLQQLQLSSRKERITKNISKVQKMYSSKMTQLEKNASLWQNNFNMQIRNTMGLGMQNQAFNPLNAGMTGGFTSFVLGQMGQFLSAGIPINRTKDNPDGTMIKLDPQRYQAMMEAYYANGLQEQVDANGKGTGKFGPDGCDFTADEVTAFKMAMTQAQNNQSMANAYVQQASSQYQSNISIWLEAAKEQLEQEQDMALLPLEAEETEIELDNQSCEAQLADAKARLESVKQACSEGIKESAPTFGLG